MVEAERQRLLLEAAEVADYLPKGVLRNASDLHIVQQRAQQLSLRR
jgi:hypothetical protein